MKKKGFTIIELLMVVAIIGLIASLLVYSVSLTRMKARDAKRKADLQQIKKALILYADNHGGLLPTSGFGYSNGGDGYATNYNNGNSCYTYGDLEDFLDGSDPDVPSPAMNYLKAPRDPKCGGCSGCGSTAGGYMYYKTSKCGTLYAHLENPSPEDTASCARACHELPGYGMNYCLDVRI